MSDFDRQNVCDLKVQGARGLGKESSVCVRLREREFRVREV